MHISKSWLKYILITILICTSFANAANKIKAVPNSVNLGTFNACLTKEAFVTLTNNNKNIFEIDKIIADCGCIRIALQSERIPVKGKMNIRIEARQITQGKLSHEIVIIPKDKENYEPINISVIGNVIKPVSVEAGWSGQDMKEYDPNNLLELDLSYKLSSKPVIAIATNNKKLKLNKVVPDVNSASFELEKFSSVEIPDDSKEQNIEKLILTLKPKDSMKIGRLQEIIKVKLADDLLLYLPIKSRIVDEAYVIGQRISLGSLANSENHEVEIHFVNNVKPWKDMKWNVEGDLSDVIDVSINKNKSTDTSIVANLDVKKSLLNNVPKGYNFSRLNFFQNDSQDESTVSVLIDGFN